MDGISLATYIRYLSGCSRRVFFSFITWQYQLSNRYYSGDHRSGWISSPRFPANYQDRTVCIWVLTLLPGTQVKVNFTSFVLGEFYFVVKKWYARNSPLSKRVADWGEDGRAFNYGIVWGTIAKVFRSRKST